MNFPTFISSDWRRYFCGTKRHGLYPANNQWNKIDKHTKGNTLCTLDKFNSINENPQFYHRWIEPSSPRHSPNKSTLSYAISSHSRMVPRTILLWLEVRLRTLSYYCLDQFWLVTCFFRIHKIKLSNCYCVSAMTQQYFKRELFCLVITPVAASFYLIVFS